MARELVARRYRGQRRRRHRRVDGRGLDDRDPALVVHHVQRLALERDRAGAVVLAVKFESAKVEALVPERAVRAQRRLAHPFAGRVVDIEGALTLVCGAIGVGRADRLPRGRDQAVAEVPHHFLQLRHRDHVAMGVVRIILVEGRAVPHRGAGQPVALGGGLEQAGLAIRIGSGPAGIRRVAALMGQLRDVAGGVVGILLRVGAHRVAVARLQQTRSRGIIV